jgi:hypothetical protein
MSDFTAEERFRQAQRAAMTRSNAARDQAKARAQALYQRETARAQAAYQRQVDRGQPPEVASLVSDGILARADQRCDETLALAFIRIERTYQAAMDRALTARDRAEAKVRSS